MWAQPIVGEMQMERREQSQAASQEEVCTRSLEDFVAGMTIPQSDSNLVNPLPTLHLFKRQILEERLACEQSTLWIQDLLPIVLHAQALFLQKFQQ